MAHVHTFIDLYGAQRLAAYVSDCDQCGTYAGKRSRTREVTVTATDIREQPAREGDTEVSVLVMRTCTFLSFRRDGQVTAHVDISPGDWQKLASAPAPNDTGQENPS